MWAWVGQGYSFGLNGISHAYDIVAATKDRPTIVTLDGWAGTQRYGGIWTGDQTGGNWEYIRFHIPTYIGQSLSGNPNVSSDIDGIFGGSSLIQTRDIQWKSFTTMMLDMDGWGSFPKKPYILVRIRPPSIVCISQVACRTDALYLFYGLYICKSR